MESFGQYIKEKWLTDGDPYKDGEIYPIFKNPNKREYAELLKALAKTGNIKTLRLLIADQGKGDIYAFDYKLLHNAAKNEISREEPMRTFIRMFYYVKSNELMIDMIGKEPPEVLKNVKSNRNVKSFLPSGVMIYFFRLNLKAKITK